MILNGGTGNGNQLLKPETVAEMSKNQMGDIRVEMLPTTNPARRSTPSSSPACRGEVGLTRCPRRPEPRATCDVPARMPPDLSR